MLGNSSSEGSKINAGKEPGDDYVSVYGRTHMDVGVDYLATNSEYLILDALLPQRYRALVLACGTAGSVFNILKNADTVVGVDLSGKMLEEAQQLATGKPVNFVPVKASITDHTPPAGERYDLIDIGLLGAYIPFEKSVAIRYLDYLAPGGILLLRVLVVPPTWAARSIVQRLKYAIRHCVIGAAQIALPRRRFFLSATSGMVQREVRQLQAEHGLKHLMTLCRNVHDEDIYNHYVVLQKPARSDST